jgi:hypothetical protein
VQNVEPPRRPFQWNRHTALLVGIILLALALPVMLVVFGISRHQASEPRKTEAAAPPTELLNSLEAVAEKSLPAPELQPGTMLEARVLAANPGDLHGTIVELVGELGGTALPATEEGNERLLISLPADSASEGLRRLELVTGTELPDAPEPGASLLIELRVEAVP